MAEPRQPAANRGAQAPARGQPATPPNGEIVGFTPPGPNNPQHPWYNQSDSVERKRLAYAGKDPFGKTCLVVIDEFRNLPDARKNAVTAVVGFAQALLADRTEDPTLVMMGRLIAETTLPHPTYASPEEVAVMIRRWARALWTKQDRQIEGMRLRMQDYVADRDAGNIITTATSPAAGGQFSHEHNSWAFILWVAERGMTDEMRHLLAISYSYAYIALSRKGTITAEKARSIGQALTREVGIPISFDRTIIPILATAMAARVGDDEYADVFQTWEREITGISLRMQITLAQAAGTGMTALNTIKNALQSFKDFDWAGLAAILPQDADRVTAAFKLVGTDKYFGFRKSYGIAASTGYRSFAWVAKELLIRYGGPEYAGLRDFRGWTNSPLHKDRLRDMVESYKPASDPATLPPYELAEMYAACAAATGV
ncbi:putative nucleoprotein [Wuhan louse fly virus 6]|uniref:Putative nucleoprotein n=1 Tax=Wuhan louse fly virus 6 TaxID=1608120 RepID=A0A0B5KRB6_9VIRU|nr:putative nucleoprotein [Wuhan louse fly virus 6]AJG39071.1 putative nucleoprotein [Wuhan louse fly virus 6]